MIVGVPIFTPTLILTVAPIFILILIQTLIQTLILTILIRLPKIRCEKHQYGKQLQAAQ